MMMLTEEARRGEYTLAEKHVHRTRQGGKFRVKYILI